MLPQDELHVAVRATKSFFYNIYDDLGFLVYDPLLRYRPRQPEQAHLPASLSDLEPRLLQSYDASDDGYLYRLHVRPGVVSGYGNALTAEDVKWSWDRALGLRRQGRFTARVAPVKNEESIVVRDKYLLEMTLEKPNIGFPHFLTSKYIPIIDSTEARRHVTGDDPWAEAWLNAHAAGFGPFRIDSYDSNADVVTYVANEHYWEKGSPRIKRLIMRGVASPTERLDMLRRGDVDIATSLAVDDFVGLQKIPGLKGVRVPGHDPLLLQMNCLRKPWDDRRVRQAVSYAIPYDRIMNDVWKGTARPLESPFVDSCYGYTRAYFKYELNLPKARALMQEAGVTSPIRCRLLVHAALAPQLTATAPVIRDALAQIGIEVEIAPVSDYDLRTTGFSHDFDLLLDPHIHMVPDGYYISVCDYGDSKWGIENVNQYYNEAVFKLQAECLQVRTEAERETYLHRMQEIIMDDAPQAYLLMINTLMGARDTVRGLAWDANGRMQYHQTHKLA